MNAIPPSFDPLRFRPTDETELAAHARNIVKNVLDSYTGKFDVLAEAVQNAVDALEERWGAGLEAAPGRLTGEVPTIRVELDAADTANTITVTDNGIGIPGHRLEEVFTPHLSPKLATEKPSRGHKGVGTTFLIYGHPSFEVRTKAEDAEVAYVMRGGSDWVRNPGTSAPPKFDQVTDGADRLRNFGRGTSITVKVDDSTRFGRLRNAQYNTTATWDLVLRTYTAIGMVSIGASEARKPEWVRALKVELELKGVAGAGKIEVVPSFQLPHPFAATKASLNEIWTGQISANNRFEMLYVELNSEALEQNLKAAIDELENSEQPGDQEILQSLRGYETQVYASWAYKNTLYEDIYRDAIAEPAAKRFQYMNVKGGLLVASVGMPIGETTDHPYATMKPEYKRRLFMLVAFNERYSPDLGRKTIPAHDRALLEWLEPQIQNLFTRHVDRLVRSNDEAPHKAGSYAEAKEELAELAERTRRQVEKLTPLPAHLAFAYQPKYEAELVGLFYAHLSTGDLPGYRLLAVPGSGTRLDGLFDFETSDFARPSPEMPVPLGIAESKAKDGAFQRRGKWLEFKVKLEDLVDDFGGDDGSASKKYFDLVDLAVVWEVPDRDAIGDFELLAIDESTWNERDFYGATHLLRKGSGNHVLQVIALEDFIRLNSAVGS